MTDVGHAVVEWLANTGWSIALHESQYGYAVVESIHVWALCLFVGFAVILDLRLVGLIFRGVPVAHMIERVLPWTRAGFVVMVISGVLLFYAIPVRTYHNVFFRAKAVTADSCGPQRVCISLRGCATAARVGR